LPSENHISNPGSPYKNENILIFPILIDFG